MAGKASRYKFGLYEANLDSGELFRNGQKLRLQEQPFQVLVALLERPAEVVTREELRQRLWPSDTFVDFDHSLNTAINKLRDTLGDGAGNPRFIETLPRRGYRFIAPVQLVGAEEESAAQTTPADADETAEIPAVVSGTELPHMSHQVARSLFGLLQVMYLIFYAVALWRLDDVGTRGMRGWNIGMGTMQAIVLVTAVIGIALRLYTMNATIFDYRHTGQNFRRIFYFVLLLDVIWAMSPFLITQWIGVGLAFASCAALVYSPFAQRVLALVAWPEAVRKSQISKPTEAQF
jgi:DNA-binding winged helix-turn-helix (wHTH) protein